MTLGIVDVGTNSIHLVIGRVRRRGAFRITQYNRVLVRLGDGSPWSRRLSRRAVRRAMVVLRRYAQTLRRRDVDHVEAVATSAIRDAADGERFVRAVRAQWRLPLRIVSGLEEARLTYHGVRAVGRVRGTVLMVAIGGGSAQVMYGRGSRPRYLTSLPLGSARLASAFIRHDPPRPSEVGAMERHVRRVWAPVGRSVRRWRCRRALGCSAMIHQLAGLAGSRAITRPKLAALVGQLTRLRAAQRRRLRGLDPDRHTFALPTAIALLAWMDACNVSRVTAVDGSLRDGLAAVCHLSAARGGSRDATAH